MFDATTVPGSRQTPFNHALTRLETALLGRGVSPLLQIELGKYRTAELKALLYKVTAWAERSVSRLTKGGEMLKVNSMKIDRVVVHSIPSRAPDKSYIAPEGGGELVKLDPTVGDLVVARITKALGSNSHGIQADFRDVADESMFARSCWMMDCTERQFIKAAGDAAEKLARVQQSKSLPPCKLIAIGGTVTSLQRPFTAFIKADMEAALTETTKNGQAVLQILKNLFMSESQKLFKIGFVRRVAGGSGMKGGVYQSDHHDIHLFDHLMTGTESRSAAFYFYSEFLGADVAASDRRLTQDFLEKTINFIKSQDFSPSKKIELGEAVRAELRSNKQTVSVADFATTHLGQRDGSAYVTFMDKAGFPDHAISKDVEYVKQRLKRRQKITFTTGVMITIPADKADLVKKVTDNHNGTTTVIVSGTVDSNE